MSTIYQNKKQPNTNLPLPNGLFQIFFFPSTLNNWFNLDDSIRNSESISIFKSTLLSFIRPAQRKYYNIRILRILNKNLPFHINAANKNASTLNRCVTRMLLK